MTNQDQDLHCIGEGLLLVVLSFGISRFIFASRYCHSLEEALKRAKKAGKSPGCFFGGIVLKSGKMGFAIYRDGKVIEQYSVIGR